jgi:hypothetical protein
MATYRSIDIIPTTKNIEEIIKPFLEDGADCYTKKNLVATEAIQALELNYINARNAVFVVNDTCRFLRLGMSFDSDDNVDFSRESTFSVEERGKWVTHKCTSCKLEFNFPIKLEVCIMCKSVCESRPRGVGKLTRNPREVSNNWEVNPELLSQAQEDLAENPVPGSNDSFVDWGHLKENLD